MSNEALPPIEEADLDILDRAVGAAARSAYDAAYVTALKTARSVVKRTNAQVALEVLDDMISVFDPPSKEEKDDESEKNEPEAEAEAEVVAKELPSPWKTQ